MGALSLATTPDPDLSLTRRERRKLELRAHILETALQLFRKQGFHATKVVEICAAADIAHKTFFNHFNSKQHLLRELAHDSVKKLQAEIDSVRQPGLSTPERLRLFFSTVAQNTADAGPMTRELVSELVHVVDDAKQRTEHAQRLHEAFGAIVKDGVAAGDITRRHDPEVLVEVILGTFYAMMFNYAGIDAFPIKAQAVSLAGFLGDALAPRPEENR